MPFGLQVPKPYTRESILGLIPDQMGVYGLFKPNQWIYIGSGNVRKLLLDHINSKTDMIKSYSPAYFLTEICNNAEHLKRRLIQEYKPVCNK